MNLAKIVQFEVLLPVKAIIGIAPYAAAARGYTGIFSSLLMSSARLCTSYFS